MEKAIKTSLKQPAVLVSICLLAICLIGASIAMNRSFMIGSLAGLSVFCGLLWRRHFNAKALVFLGLPTILALVLLPLLVKTDSSLGRLLIYKISFRMFAGHWLTGIGFGNFQIKYGQYQAAYFASGNYSSKELLLADNTYFAFNDYWQWIIETGVIGVTILMAAFTTVVRIALVAFAKKPDSIMVRFIVSLLVVVTVAALFTHVFEKAAFRAIALAAVLYLSIVVIKDKLPALKTSALVVACSLLVAAFPTYRQALNFRSYKKIEEAKMLISTGNIAEGMAIYHTVFPRLKDDVAFLEAYCNELITSGNPYEALRILKFTLTKRTSNRLYRDLGNLYFQLKQFKEAEKAYLISINMVPNRFVNRLCLMEFYIKVGDVVKAKQTANFILNMPVKVPSALVRKVRGQAFAVSRQ